MNDTLISNFVDNINSLSRDNVDEVLSEIYTNEVEFIDPVKGVNGLHELTQYFSNMYKSVDKCHFIITNYVSDGTHHSIEWDMTLKHQKLARNKEITLQGASFIMFDNNKVCYHRDYYDLGALIYERLPILGYAVRTVRNAF